MMQNNTCQKPNLWYYSCKWCGKCEYNANHTFSRSTDGKDTSNRVFPSHQFQAYNLSDKNYIGTNERGEKIYCSSCIWCGISYRDAMTDQKASWAVGGDMYTEAMKSTVDLYRWPAFAVPGGRDVNARVRAWAAPRKTPPGAVRAAAAPSAASTPSLRPTLGRPARSTSSGTASPSASGSPERRRRRTGSPEGSGRRGTTSGF